MNHQSDAGVIIVGGGHAGVEAALASARLGVATLLVTGDPEKICTLPCNPSIGGSAKGQLVREIDALGGAMGRLADRCSLHARFLNESKGPAVRALRQQMDKPAYARDGALTSCAPAQPDHRARVWSTTLMRRSRRRRAACVCADGSRYLRTTRRARDRHVLGRKDVSRRRRASRRTLRRSAGDRAGARVAAPRISDAPLKNRHAAAHRQDDASIRSDAGAAAERGAAAVFVHERSALRRAAAAVLRHRNQRAHARARARQPASLAAVRVGFDSKASGRAIARRSKTKS